MIDAVHVRTELWVGPVHRGVVHHPVQREHGIGLNQCLGENADEWDEAGKDEASFIFQHYYGLNLRSFDVMLCGFPSELLVGPHTFTKCKNKKESIIN